MAGTYNPYGPNGMIWSAAGATPFEDPSSQMLSLALGTGVGLGAIVGLQNWSVGSQGNTAYDLVQKTVRNIASATPFGLGNTFRIPEFMSPHLSATAQGLTPGTSVTSSAKKVSVFSLGPEYTTDASTRRMLRAVVGEEAFTKSGLDSIADGSYELRFERQEAGSGRGSLFAREVSYDPSTRKLQGSGKWRQLSNAVNLFELHGAADVLDVASGKFNPLKTNTAYQAVLQNLGVTGDLDKGQIEKILSKVDPDTGKIIGRSRYSFAPSIGGPKGTWGDIRRRIAMPGGPAAASMQRWNRLVDATIEQVPFRNTLSSLFGDTGPFSVKVTPGPAPKMFAQLGIKGAKIGAAVLGMQQLDHYRRQYGTAGEVLVSGGISAGIYGLLKKNASGLSPIANRNIAIASFFGQMLLPGFDQGIGPGIATTGTKLDIGVAAIGELTMASTYRRTLEGFLPGISDWTTGAAIGVGVTAASYFTKLPKYLMNRPGSILPSGVVNKIGFAPGVGKLDVPKNLGQLYFEELIDMATTGGGNTLTKRIDPTTGINRVPPWQMSEKDLTDILRNKPIDKVSRLDRLRLGMALRSKTMSAAGDSIDNASWLQDELYARKQKAQALKTQAEGSNPINESLRRRVGEIYDRYGAQPSSFQKVKRSLELASTQFYHSFFGATMKGGEFKTAMESVNFQNFKLGRAGTLFFGTMLAHRFLTSGLFGSMETPGELSDIYSGEQYVKVKRGRWWEAGGTPFEGGETEYMRPHAYVSYMTRAREKALWGEGEDQISPIKKFFLRNFTYEMERMTYHTRPYPMTAGAFSDVPIVGNILAATIGRIIKPPRLMHTSEWLRMNEAGELEIAHRPEWHGPSMELGGLPMGKPRSQFDTSFAAANAQYQFREIEGMTGWAKNMIQKGLTGTETFGTTYPVFGSAGAMTDPIEAFWDMNIGGGLFMSEPIRRFLPRPRSEIEEYNPIMNSMPTWMPDRFKFGDPYRKIESGYARLPGAGYAALHPELQGIDPEAYPDIYKYAILADISPQSKSTMDLRTQLYQRRMAGITSVMENTFMDTIDRNLSETMVARQFDHVHANAIELPGSSLTQAAYAKAQNVARDITAPAEFLIPMGFRPMQKLMGDRGMIEQYEFERMYGTNNAFWNKPWRDWLRPSMYSAAHMMGFEGKPQWRKEADETQAYFDRLEFVKWMQLANQPNITGKERSFYLRNAQGTRYGVNPQGDAMSIYMSLPESEKKFFDAFSMATGSDRDRILQMVPEDQAHLYQAVWSRQDAGEPIMPYTSRTLTGPTTQVNLDAQYEQLMNEWSGPMPAPDWIGWHKDVEMDDVKLKYIDNLGKDLYDYGLYAKQHRVMARKPYLEGSDQFLYQGPSPGRSSVYSAIRSMGSSDTFVNTASGTHNTKTTSEFHYNDNREGAIMSFIKSWVD